MGRRQTRDKTKGAKNFKYFAMGELMDSVDNDTDRGKDRKQGNGNGNDNNHDANGGNDNDINDNNLIHEKSNEDGRFDLEENDKICSKQANDPNLLAMKLPKGKKIKTIAKKAPKKANTITKQKRTNKKSSGGKKKSDFSFPRDHLVIDNQENNFNNDNCKNIAGQTSTGDIPWKSIFWKKNKISLDDRTELDPRVMCLRNRTITFRF